MDKTRYKYWLLESHGLYGKTDLRDCIGSPVGLNGWTLLLCTEGCATVNINFKKQAIRKGDVVFLSYDMHFIPLQVSKGFSVVFLTVSMEIADNAFFRIAYSSFWDYLYEYPIQPTTGEQLVLLLQWCQQTEWILRCDSEKIVAEMLTNNLFNLMTAVLMEVEKHETEKWLHKIKAVAGHLMYSFQYWSAGIISDIEK